MTRQSGAMTRQSGVMTRQSGVMTGQTVPAGFPGPGRTGVAHGAPRGVTTTIHRRLSPFSSNFLLQSRRLVATGGGVGPGLVGQPSGRQPDPGGRDFPPHGEFPRACASLISLTGPKIGVDGAPR
ncbi:hypothetical protein H4W31_006820 [Plantactinospora soyae]|uniref:Uncharacterized protein n=1 Tax=Plantactinospora soyae TaxID=1544732 RepID=A0A927MAV4_9ACTN|nr:hypothetical protein [Plantactinospora soyae]